MGNPRSLSVSNINVFVKPKRKPVLVNNPTSSSLKLLILNCQSIVAKKPSFPNIINENNPDFIAGTESWLLETIHNNKIFPSTHTISR